LGVCQEDDAGERGRGTPLTNPMYKEVFVLILRATNAILASRLAEKLVLII